MLLMVLLMYSKRKMMTGRQESLSAEASQPDAMIFWLGGNRRECLPPKLQHTWEYVQDEYHVRNSCIPTTPLRFQFHCKSDKLRKHRPQGVAPGLLLEVHCNMECLVVGHSNYRVGSGTISYVISYNGLPLVKFMQYSVVCFYYDLQPFTLSYNCTFLQSQNHVDHEFSESSTESITNQPIIILLEIFSERCTLCFVVLSMLRVQSPAQPILVGTYTKNTRMSWSSLTLQLFQKSFKLPMTQWLSIAKLKT